MHLENEYYTCKETSQCTTSIFTYPNDIYITFVIPVLKIKIVSNGITVNEINFDTSLGLIPVWDGIDYDSNIYYLFLYSKENKIYTVIEINNNATVTINMIEKCINTNYKSICNFEKLNNKYYLFVHTKDYNDEKYYSLLSYSIISNGIAKPIILLTVKLTENEIEEGRLIRSDIISMSKKRNRLHMYLDTSESYIKYVFKNDNLISIKRDIPLTPLFILKKKNNK